MNDRTFAEMAEQMQPDQAVLDDLLKRLQATGAAELPTPAQAAPQRHPAMPRARWWIGASAALVAGALLVPAAGSMPGAGRPTATVPSAAQSAADYARLYSAAAAGAARQPGAADAVASAYLSGRSRVSYVAASGGWSTNVQVAGIDEGDIVKSDGESIFLASGTRVAILTSDGARTRELAAIDTSTGEAAKQLSDGTVIQGPVVELALNGTTLVVLVTEYRARTSALPSVPQQTSTTVPFDAALTKALLYDVADPANPRYLTSLGQSGALVTTRLAGEVLYLVTAYTLDPDSMDPDDPRTFVPLVTEGGAVQTMRVADCGFVAEPTGPTYSVVGSIDVAERTRIDTQSVLGGAGTVYMNESNLYLAVTDHQPSEKKRTAAGVSRKLSQVAVTELSRIGVDEGQLELSAQGSVPGTVLNQFALDEYETSLRLVTTVEGNDAKGRWSRRASLFVLGPDLRRVGSIPSLVTGERVESVRFAGPIGYVVTFRQVDPLFAIDLSNPAEPRVLSELKIPGFSTYLQQWSETRLLGVGRNVNRRSDGLKLSMFDTSDPLDVSEMATLKVGGTDAEALTDHRAVLVDPAERLIGFAVVTHRGSGAKLEYQTFRYEEGSGFVRSATLRLETGARWPVPSVRGLVVGDFLYVTSSRGVVDVLRTAGFDRVATVRVSG